jgi:CheY-like chemotaxis protein
MGDCGILPRWEATSVTKMTLKVLVVEDDSLVRAMATETLEEAGFAVVEAATGEEAMRHCGERTADVLFTDIRLPGAVDGWDIAERCREANPKLEVIYATGYSALHSRRVPRSTLFHKPYTPEQLVNAVAAAGRCVQRDRGE